MSTRYWECENVNRTVGGIVFSFYGVHGGATMGLYRTDVDSENAALAAAAADSKNGVWEITEAQYFERAANRFPVGDGWKFHNKKLYLRDVAQTQARFRPVRLHGDQIEVADEAVDNDNNPLTYPGYTEE